MIVNTLGIKLVNEMQGMLQMTSKEQISTWDAHKY